jgi:hypothetical protein
MDRLAKPGMDHTWREIDSFTFGATPFMEQQAPVALNSHRIGIRELCLLLIASGFALLMMDLGNVALIAGCAVVALWTWSMFVGPKPSPALTITYGAGLFVTCFWWPREGWWMLAIALTWTGIALMTLGAGALVANRIRRASP